MKPALERNGNRTGMCGRVCGRVCGRLLAGFLAGPQPFEIIGGEYRNRTGVHGFAIRCVTTPPTRPCALETGCCLFAGWLWKGRPARSGGFIAVSQALVQPRPLSVLRGRADTAQRMRPVGLKRGRVRQPPSCAMRPMMAEGGSCPCSGCQAFSSPRPRRRASGPGIRPRKAL